MSPAKTFRVAAVVADPDDNYEKIELVTEHAWSAMTSVIEALAVQTGLPLDSALLNRHQIIVMTVVRQ